MKKRINELLNGKIDDNPQTLEVSEDRIFGIVKENEYYNGKFSIRVKEGKSIQGFLFSSDPRMGFKPDIFVGSSETFRFEADTTGLQAKEKLSGEFILSTSAGEYKIPYEIKIEGNEEDRISEQDELTPEQFTELAKNDFSRAYMLFVTRGFRKYLEYWGAKYETLYEGISSRPFSYESLEQFLVGAGLKDSCKLSVETDHKCLRNIIETRKEELAVIKDNWGFEKIEFACDADFIQIERPQITTDEFVGSVYYMSYLVRKEKLHAGRNFAKLTISYGCEKISSVIEVKNEQNGSHERSLHRQKQEIVQLMSAYIRYRTGKMKSEDWSGISLKSLDNYRRCGGKHIFFDLYEIYILFMQEDMIQAELLLSQIRDRKKELKDSGWKGFYLYLLMLQSNETEYQEHLRDEIGRLFLANQENWILQWLLFRTNEKAIKNDTEKLDCIRRQYLCGCSSPILYLDAYDILKKEPLMLRKLESFEIHLLSFICREKLLDREISGQTAQLAGRCQEFDPVLFRILCECYEVYPTKNLLTAICAMLIKGRKNNPEYGKWFAMGIKQDVRLTGMYEYFVETARDLSDRMLPQSVRMYFIYHNTLDYVRKALIYANIIRNRNRDQHTYETYRDAMSRFMEEQLEQGRVNKDLALLYEVLLSKELMTEPLATGLQKVLFTYEVACNNPQLRHVVVIHKALQQEQRVMLENGIAYVQIFSPEYTLLVEDSDGNRYAGEPYCRIKKLLTRTVFEDYCREMLELPLGILLHDCTKDQEGICINQENISNYIRLLNLQKLKEEYRENIQKKMISYFSEHQEDEHLVEFLNMIDCKLAAEKQKKEIARLLAQTDRFTELFEVVRVLGAEKIELSILVRMCSFCITETEEQEDKMLLAVCVYCFEQNLYDEKILGYLLKYFEGPVELMKAIWYAAETFGLSSFAFEEKILGLLLLVQQQLDKTEPIFAAYVKNLGKSRICRAYVTRMSYEYFVKERDVQEPVFRYMEQNMAGNVEVPDVCRLALLRWYAKLPQKTAGQQKWLIYLLENYLERGMHFAFYEELPQKIRKQYHLHDKHILEYRTKSGRDVILHYRLNGQKEQSIMMTDIFEGIYTKEFTMFYKDTLEWYYIVDIDGTKIETEKEQIVWSEKTKKSCRSRYDLINRLIQAEEEHKEEEFKEICKQYHVQQEIVEQIFQIN